MATLLSIFLGGGEAHLENFKNFPYYILIIRDIYPIDPLKAFMIDPDPIS